MTKDDLWKERIEPLIKKRNKILDKHGNTMESFELPEIKKIDQELDRLEMQEYNRRKKDTKFDEWIKSYVRKIMEENMERIKKEIDQYIDERLRELENEYFS